MRDLLVRALCGVVGMALLGCEENQGGATATPAAKTTEQKERQDTQAPRNAASDQKDSLAEFRGEMEKALAKVDERINKLQEQVREEGADLPAETRRRLDQLVTDRNELAWDIQQLESAGAEEWRAMKAGINDALQGLKVAVDDVEAEIEAELNVPSGEGGRDTGTPGN